jgi:hypothetical protein
VTAQTWTTIAELATALGTMILAIATFSAVRSANLSARVAQQALLEGMRPVLMPSRIRNTRRRGASSKPASRGR